MVAELFLVLYSQGPNNAARRSAQDLIDKLASHPDYRLDFGVSRDDVGKCQLGGREILI